MRRPIKHILDDTVVDEAGAVVRSIGLVFGVTAADPYGAAQSQVNAGSAVVTSIQMMLSWFIDNKVNASTLTYDRLDWYIWYNIAGAQARPDPRTAGQFDLKNQIMHMGSAILGANTAANANGNAQQVGRVDYDFYFKVPKWAQKINKDDVIELVYVFSDAAAVHTTKLKAIFMEYEQS